MEEKPRLLGQSPGGSSPWQENTESGWNDMTGRVRPTRTPTKRFVSLVVIENIKIKNSKGSQRPLARKRRKGPSVEPGEVPQLSPSLSHIHTISFIHRSVIFDCSDCMLL